MHRIPLEYSRQVFLLAASGLRIADDGMGALMGNKSVGSSKTINLRLLSIRCVHTRVPVVGCLPSLAVSLSLR